MSSHKGNIVHFIMRVVNKVKYSINKVIMYAFLIRNVVRACEKGIERGKNLLGNYTDVNVQRKNKK